MQTDLVIDSSIFLAAVLPDENNSIAELIFDEISKGNVNICVPGIFYAEVLNALLMSYKRDRISQYEINKYIDLLQNMYFVNGDDKDLLKDCVNNAKKYGLTIYDSSYLTLALYNEIKLASLDKKMIAAAKVEGIYYGL